MADQQQNPLRALLGSRIGKVAGVILGAIAIYVAVIEAWRVTVDLQLAKQTLKAKTFDTRAIEAEQRAKLDNCNNLPNVDERLKCLQRLTRK